MQKAIRSVVALMFLTSSAAAIAQEPAENIDRTRHGELAAAQTLVRQAFDRLTVAQQNNHNALGGHAGRAKDLLRQVNDEIRLAADAANKNPQSQ